jgi:hypothetical protein
MTIKLGTQAGRHPMPVDRYLLAGDVGVGQEAYDAAFAAAQAWLKEPGNFAQMREGVELYYAGLTEVTLGVLDAFQASGYAENVVLFRYDRDQGYVPLRRVVPAEGAQSATMWVVDQRQRNRTTLATHGLAAAAASKPLVEMTDAEAAAAGLITITPAVP